jgi:site-specific DNA recombinase
METYRRAQTLMQRGAEAYRLGGPDVRRLLTQAFLARIEVDTEDERATLASPWREIREAAGLARPHAQGRPTAQGRSTKMNPDHLDGQGSNRDPLVELRGLEPLTPSMPWRCATNCATAPCRSA